MTDPTGQQVSETAKWCQHCGQRIERGPGGLLYGVHTASTCYSNPGGGHETAEATRIWDAKNLRWIAEPAEPVAVPPAPPGDDVDALINALRGYRRHHETYGSCRIELTGDRRCKDCRRADRALEGKRA
jgi:hypothetical protein